jgi:heme/copper-type cytochrome/quinol oxidase subunit 4
MTKETLVFIFGILLTILPFLGIPEEWRYYGVSAIGVILIFIGYSLRHLVYLSRIDKGNGERATDSFVETTEQLWSTDGLK